MVEKTLGHISPSEFRKVSAVVEEDTPDTLIPIGLDNVEYFFLIIVFMIIFAIFVLIMEIKYTYFQKYLVGKMKHSAGKKIVILKKNYKVKPRRVQSCRQLSNRIGERWAPVQGNGVNKIRPNSNTVNHYSLLRMHINN